MSLVGGRGMSSSSDPSRPRPRLNLFLLFRPIPPPSSTIQCTDLAKSKRRTSPPFSDGGGTEKKKLFYLPPTQRAIWDASCIENYIIPLSTFKENWWTVFNFIWGYLQLSGKFILLKMSISISMCTNGPRKQCGGGRRVQRWAAAGGWGKVPPTTQ